MDLEFRGMPILLHNKVLQIHYSAPGTYTAEPFLLYRSRRLQLYRIQCGYGISSTCCKLFRCSLFAFGQPTQCTDLSTGGATSWNWDFGDGSTSTQQSPSHTYTASGTYSVTLLATATPGGCTSTITQGRHRKSAAGGKFFCHHRLLRKYYAVLRSVYRRRNAMGLEFRGWKYFYAAKSCKYIHCPGNIYCHINFNWPGRM